MGILNEINYLNNPPRIYQRTITLDNNAIKLLPSTPVVLIPSVGENKLIIPIQTSLITNFAAAYTNLDPDHAFGLILDPDNWFTTYSCLIYGSNIWAQTDNSLVSLLPAMAPAPVGASFIEAPTLISSPNTPVVFGKITGQSTDFTGGNPTNKLLIGIEYRILNTLTVQFE